MINQSINQGLTSVSLSFDNIGDGRMLQGELHQMLRNGKTKNVKCRNFLRVLMQRESNAMLYKVKYQLEIYNQIKGCDKEIKCNARQNINCRYTIKSKDVARNQMQCKAKYQMEIYNQIKGCDKDIKYNARQNINCRYTIKSKDVTRKSNARQNINCRYTIKSQDVMKK